MRTTLLCLALLVLAAAPRLAEAQGAPRIGRLGVSPADLTVTVGDTMRIRVEVFDPEGSSIPEASLRFQAIGGQFEGSVDPSGLVTAGATGTLPVGVFVIVPGADPVPVRLDVQMVPGPAAVVTVDAAPSRLVVGQRVTLRAQARSRYGDVITDLIRWGTSAPSVATVDAGGRVTALQPGRVTISAESGPASTPVTIEVVPNNIASIQMSPVVAQGRQGDVIRFEVSPRDAQGRPIEGLTPAFSFSPGNGMIDPDGAFVGYLPGEYVVTANFGDRIAEARVTLTPRAARRPLRVVGRLPRTLFTTEEVWVHPNGEVVYLGTGGGGDRMYAIDVTDPTNPVVTDSLMADTRRVNDVMTTPDGRYLVHTREGASSRRNGIVIASLEDPRHPKVIAEFTEGVTAGVHSAFVYEQPGYGTHVYLTNNGTNAMHVIDISDAANPREVAQWRSPTPAAGGSLHDIDVQDGIAYLSNWNDGLIVLDVGNGIRGGSPSNPQLITTYKYDLNEMYRNVEVDGGPGFIRGTHTAWRHRNYVFIADEVFPADSPPGTRDASASRAYGNLQVIDVSDWDNPRSVAWYIPEDGGVHNVWVDGEVLYMGAYDSGFRAFDVSGELRGDLRAQGREIAHLNPADMEGRVQNTAMTWGVVVKDGLAYVNDMYNGLWIVRVELDSDG